MTTSRSSGKAISRAVSTWGVYGDYFTASHATTPPTTWSLTGPKLLNNMPNVRGSFQNPGTVTLAAVTNNMPPPFTSPAVIDREQVPENTLVLQPQQYNNQKTYSIFNTAPALYVWFDNGTDDGVGTVGNPDVIDDWAISQAVGNITQGDSVNITTPNPPSLYGTYGVPANIPRSPWN